MPIPESKALVVLEDTIVVTGGQEYTLASVTLSLVPHLYYILEVGLPGVQIDGTAKIDIWLRINGADQFRIGACGNDASQGAVQGYPLRTSCLLPAEDDYVERTYAVVAKATGRDITILSGQTPSGGPCARAYIQVIEFGALSLNA